MSSLLTFALAFVLRPIGGIGLGHFGDRLGRKRMLVLTLLTMTLCSGLIGLLPSYQAIGAWAPALLSVMRMSLGARHE